MFVAALSPWCGTGWDRALELGFREGNFMLLFIYFLMFLCFFILVLEFWFGVVEESVGLHFGELTCVEFWLEIWPFVYWHC